MHHAFSVILLNLCAYLLNHVNSLAHTQVDIKSLQTYCLLRERKTCLCHTIICLPRLPYPFAYNIFTVTAEKWKLHTCNLGDNLVIVYQQKERFHLRKAKTKFVTLHLLNPMDNCNPSMRAFCESFEVYKHWFPFRPELVIPEEIPNQHRRHILKFCSATQNRWAGLTNKTQKRAEKRFTH